MTADEIARLRALCEKATPGPWRTGNASADDFWHGKGSILHDEKVLFVGNVNFDLAADAAFIAAARTALPSALDEIERLRSAQAKAMCTWCGFEASGDNRAKIIVDHIESCASVPWNLVEENERLRKIITDAGLDPDAGRAEKMAGDE